jgi:hypothetical protein
MGHAHQGAGWGDITQDAIDDRIALIENNLTRPDRAAILLSAGDSLTVHRPLVLQADLRVFARKAVIFY